MTISLNLPEKQSLSPTITVFGVGGAGGNAVANMITSDLQGVNFVVANTDAQALAHSACDSRIQLGEAITQGLGAGSYPEVGKASAEEAIDEINDYLQGSNMVFVTAGLGGGTGTGAAPVIARMAREQGILTVGVVTKPFQFEGAHRMRVAELGLQELVKYVDTLIVIPNQNLFRIADKNTTFLDAFKMADEVLHDGVRGITDLMVRPGMINLDFSDVRAIMSEMGKAMMGTGEGEGEQRAVEAAEAAIANPLLDNVSMKGAKGVLINITGGPDLTLFEMDEAANRIREEVDPDANIIFGSTFDQELQGKVRVSVVATGIDMEESHFHNQGARQSFNAPRVEAPKAAPPAEVIEVAEEQPQPVSPAKAEPMTERPAPNVETLQAANSTQSEQEDDVFVAPEPEEPKEVASKIEREEPRVAEPSLANTKERLGDSPKQASPQHGGLFGSLFNSKKETAKQVEAEEQALDLDENLDIPAFLRRKP